MGFWLQLGVSGFRLDAVPFVIAQKGADLRKAQPSNTICCERSASSLHGGRARLSSSQKRTYFQTRPAILRHSRRTPADDVQLDVNQNLFYALASGDARPMVKAVKATRKRPETAQWGNFLRNHDELDLGRLEDTQKQQVFNALRRTRLCSCMAAAFDEGSAPMLQGDRRRLELAYSLMLTWPGTPVIRYGDEIAMGDNLKLRNVIAHEHLCSGRPNR